MDDKRRGSDLKINKIKKRMCYGKIAYKNMKDARRKCRAMKYKGGGVYNIYRCPFCDMWHIGHRSRFGSNYVKKLLENNNDEKNNIDIDNNNDDDRVYSQKKRCRKNSKSAGFHNNRNNRV